jgi:hypothetical protein
LIHSYQKKGLTQHVKSCKEKVAASFPAAGYQTSLLNRNFKPLLPALQAKAGHMASRGALQDPHHHIEYEFVRIMIIIIAIHQM